MAVQLYDRLYVQMHMQKLRDANVKVRIQFNKAARQWQVALVTPTTCSAQRAMHKFACDTIASYLNKYSHPLKGKPL